MVTVDPGEMRCLQASDRWPRGRTYVRRFEVLVPDETGDLVPADLSDWQYAVDAGVEGTNGARPPAGAEWAFAEYDEDRGGAAAGAMKITIVADALDLGRAPGAEVGTIRWTVAVRKGPDEGVVVANVVTTVEETALR